MLENVICPVCLFSFMREKREQNSFGIENNVVCPICGYNFMEDIMLENVTCPVCGLKFIEDVREGDRDLFGFVDKKIVCGRCGFNKFYIDDSMVLNGRRMLGVTWRDEDVEEWKKIIAEKIVLKSIRANEFSKKMEIGGIERDSCHVYWDKGDVVIDFDGVFMGLFQVVESSELAYPVAVVMDESGYLHIISPEYIRIYV